MKHIYIKFCGAVTLFMSVVGALPPALFAFERPSNYAPQVKIPITIKLKSKVQVESSRINLSDIANCLGIDAACEEGSAIDFGSAPEPGKSVSLYKKQIESLLLQEWPDVKAVVEGPSQIIVEAQAEEVSIDEVKAVISSLYRNLEQEDETIQIEIVELKLPVGLKKRLGSYHYAIADGNQSMPSIESLLNESVGQMHRIVMQMWPEEDNGSDKKTFTVALKTLVKRFVPVAVKPIRKGEVIGEEQIKMSWEPVTTRFGDYFTQREQVLGKFAKTDIGSNQLITERAVDVPNIVQRGQTVNVRFRSGELSVSTKGKVMKSAKMHQDTEVYFPTTKKTMKVKVVAAEEVEVIY